MLTLAIGCEGETQVMRPPKWLSPQLAMREQQKIRVSQLREIGWSQWDPLYCFDRELFDEGDGGPNSDEYDSVLLHVAGLLSRGEPAEAAIAYLEQVEADRYGRCSGRAKNTVAAIGKYLGTIPPGSRKVRQWS